MIRTEAFNDLRYNFSKVENRAKVNNEEYEDLIDEIDHAKQMSLFNMHRSNIPGFFRPKHTETISELESLAKKYSKRIQDNPTIVNLEM